MKKSLIFTFGNVGVGKSTILAAICKDFQDNDNFHVINNFDTPEELRILNLQWIDRLEQKKFPPRSNPNQTYVIDLGLISEKSDDKLVWSFFEMSGEHFESLDLERETSDGRLKSELIEYVGDSDLCLIMTDVNSAQEDDRFINFFIQNIINEGIDDIPIALVVSKWDLLKKNRSIENFVADNLPKTIKWFKSKKFFSSKRIFSFSVGKVKEDVENNAAAIDHLNIDLDELPKWLYEQLS